MCPAASLMEQGAPVGSRKNADKCQAMSSSECIYTLNIIETKHTKMSFYLDFKYNWHEWSLLLNSDFEFKMDKEPL